MSIFSRVCDCILNYNYQASPLLFLNVLSWLLAEGDKDKKKGKEGSRKVIISERYTYNKLISVTKTSLLSHGYSDTDRHTHTHLCTFKWTLWPPTWVNNKTLINHYFIAQKNPWILLKTAIRRIFFFNWIVYAIS